jgi:hypothetical protein
MHVPAPGYLQLELLVPVNFGDEGTVAAGTRRWLPAVHARQMIATGVGVLITNADGSPANNVSVRIVYPCSFHGHLLGPGNRLTLPQPEVGELLRTNHVVSADA